MPEMSQKVSGLGKADWPHNPHYIDCLLDDVSHDQYKLVLHVVKSLSSVMW